MRHHEQNPLQFLERIKKAQERTPVLPGLISWFRIVLAPLAVLALIRGSYGTLFWMVVAAALSDYADGLVARKLKKTSYPGKILDFLADKFFLSILLVMLERTGAMNSISSMITAWYHIGVLAASAMLSWSVRLPVVAVPTSEKLVIVTSYSFVIVACGVLAFPWKAVFTNLLWVLSIITPVSVLFGVVAYFRISRRVLSRFLA
ncbi:MAG: CDP-alcohol phosphatidyltransferase family protein [Candidatus Fermentibacteraceae bacterium]